MCGIAGFYGFKDDKLIKKISKELEHRGPDGEGIFTDEKVTLLNRRLAIIDLKTGDQPIYNEDESIATVYNGEIYNYKELRKTLEEKGHRFKTLSDTEVIVHAYETWGDECFDQFNGMFAIAIYDKKEERLVLARDHFGIKPLYFTILSKSDPVTAFPPVSAPPIKSGMRAVGIPSSRATRFRLIFSSEITPIINSGLIEKKPNEKTLYRYLQYRVHDESPETFFKDVYRLMPGQMLSIEKGKMRNRYYSSLEEQLKTQNSNVKTTAQSSKLTESQIQEFKKKLIKVIKMRLISDVPIGTCLSGGLDSSTVVMTINKLLEENVSDAKAVGKNQNTFSAVFPNSSNDEEHYVDKILEKANRIVSHKIHPKPEEFFGELEDFIKTQEEPTISTGPYAQYKVMQTASKYVKVLLDGQGVDEMMAGYLPYYFVYFRQLKKERKWGKLFQEILSSFDVISKYAVLKLRSAIWSQRQQTLLAKSFKRKHANQTFKTVNDNLKLRLIDDIFYNSLPSLLRYEDRNSMRFSIEGRVPFLDFNLVKYIFSLSDEAIIQSGWNKNILRKAMKDLLPDLIVKRRNKIGFTTPEEEWFLRMKNRMYSVFLSESFASRPYFNQQEVLRALRRFIEGKSYDTLLLWRILNTELWFRVFFDPPSHKPASSAGRASEGQVKKIEKVVGVGGKNYERHLIKTDVFQKGDDMVKKISDYILSSRFKSSRKKWFVVISEKIVAISQGRSYYIWDIKPSFFAKLLSRYVTKTPFGIGLGSPWTMELAIREIGLPKILFASLAAAVTKPFGAKGTFYKIAGPSARSIDGPTEYSLYPSNVSAKLAPKDPQKVAVDITEYLRDNLKLSDEKHFKGVAIIDANDLGRNILGNATTLEDKRIEEIFRDNPMGQGTEQTPIATVIEG